MKSTVRIIRFPARNPRGTEPGRGGLPPDCGPVPADYSRLQHTPAGFGRLRGGPRIRPETQRHDSKTRRQVSKSKAPLPGRFFPVSFPSLQKTNCFGRPPWRAPRPEYDSQHPAGWRKPLDGVLAPSPSLSQHRDARALDIQRANHLARHGLKNVGIDHGRFHVVMPKQFLDRPYVVSHLQQMGRITVPEGMGRNAL